MSEQQPSGWAIGWTAFAGIMMIMMGGWWVIVRLVGLFNSATEAIELAVQPRVTGRPEHNSGEGLFFSLEFVKANRGRACVYSQDGALWVRGKRSWTQPVPFWPGTWVSLCFRCDCPVNTTAIYSRYAPPENDFDWLI